MDEVKSKEEANSVVELEMLKQAEDDVRGIINKWPNWKQAIAYLYLYNLGIRISDVDRIIRERLREKHDWQK